LGREDLEEAPTLLEDEDLLRLLGFSADFEDWLLLPEDEDFLDYYEDEDAFFSFTADFFVCNFLCSFKSFSSSPCNFSPSLSLELDELDEDDLSLPLRCLSRVLLLKSPS